MLFLRLKKPWKIVLLPWLFESITDEEEIPKHVVECVCQSWSGKFVHACLHESETLRDVGSIEAKKL